MTRKTNPVVVTGAVLALAGVVVLAVLAGRGSSTGGATKEVLVASAPVTAGTSADAAQLVVKKIPASAVPVGALTSASAVSGKVALHSLSKGQVVTPDAFGQQGVAATGGVVLPAGKQGLGVELGFAPGGLRYVVPGNHITIWASSKTGVTKMILPSVEVIATTPGSGTGAATDVTPGPGNLDFLLAVSPTEAAQVIAAQTSGATLYFTLAATGQKG